jgi:hypothetical protein
MTLGEKRVRVNFNPSNQDLVQQIKEKSAELINLLESIREDELRKVPPVEKSNEKMRLISLAQTAYEEAAMWAVKAATV